MGCSLHHGTLCLLDYPPHGAHSLDRELAVCHLTAQHHHAAAVEHSIGDIASFCSCREGFVLHGGKHLGCCDYDLACCLGLLNHHLLRHEDFLHRYFHSQVTAGNHNAVRLGKNLVKVCQSLDVLNLGDNLDRHVAAMLPAVADVLCTLHEAERYVVSLHRYSPLRDVEDFSLIDHRDVNLHTRDVHVLLLTQAAIIHHPGHDVIGAHFCDLQYDRTILDQYHLSRADIAGECTVRDGHLGLVTL
mmetsp:Transcript_32681/g.75989  ORF Transcript_32681/g.75989 Transcript_32681/m.75989 type:complete len:245 (-) Transcript_32681:481-1215(-)